MQTPIDINLVSLEEYLQDEQISEIKHEYVCGQVFAMSGASSAHNLIAGNIYALLRSIDFQIAIADIYEDVF
jgi:Uma2 family endonuclease